MPTRPRPPKAAGADNYQAEVARGVPDIIDAEIDLDFSTLYTLINGQLDDDNIAGFPKKIAYSKLNLTGSIQAGDLAPGAAGGNIAANSITLAQLAFGASVQTLLGFSAAAPIGLSLGAEYHILDFPFNTRSATPLTFLVGVLNAEMNLTGIESTLTAQLRVDGSPGGVDGTSVASAFTRGSAASGIQAPATVIVFGITPLAAGSHRVSLTATLTGGPNATAVSYQLVAIQWA